MDTDMDPGGVRPAGDSTVLLAEFGQGLLSDPGLGEMIGELSTTLRDPVNTVDEVDVFRRAGHRVAVRLHSG